MLIEALVIFVVPFGLAFAAASDLTTMTIPNRLQLILVSAFALAAFAAGMSLPTVGMHLGAGVLVLAVAFGCFAFGWIGGGDAKLAAVTALWLGFGATLMQYLLLAAIYGGVLALGLLWLRTQPLPALLAGQGWVTRLHDEKSGIPYGIALAAAALTVWPHSSFMRIALGG
jgi:prepilin peptidase CpaA